MSNVFGDILDHQKGCKWSDEILQIAFLIKYYDSSAYRRLYIFSNYKLPLPSTIDSHFEKKVNFVEHCLTNINEIDFILDTYWNSNKNEIKNLSNNSIDSFKIQIVLGCEAV